MPKPDLHADWLLRAIQHPVAFTIDAAVIALLAVWLAWIFWRVIEELAT